MLGLLIEKFSEIIPTKFWYLWMAAAMAWLFDYNMSCFKKGITLIPGSGTVCKYENPLLFWSVSVFWTLVYGVSFLYLIYLLFT